ncbi:unnamed protein product [Symbiodinium natans]|uniref:Uncharacterized protein n=1 Tax=Symbiodinium natans TaxID=878477 RepID=A0A812PDQ7_9DINO|nr:unnamed protein product [Symbiodinium natans]
MAKQAGLRSNPSKEAPIKKEATKKPGSAARADTDAKQQTSKVQGLASIKKEPAMKQASAQAAAGGKDASQVLASAPIKKEAATKPGSTARADPAQQHTSKVQGPASIKKEPAMKQASSKPATQAAAGGKDASQVLASAPTKKEAATKPGPTARADPAAQQQTSKVQGSALIKKEPAMKQASSNPGAQAAAGGKDASQVLASAPIKKEAATKPGSTVRADTAAKQQTSKVQGSASIKKEPAMKQASSTPGTQAAAGGKDASQVLASAPTKKEAATKPGSTARADPAQQQTSKVQGLASIKKEPATKQASANPATHGRAGGKGASQALADGGAEKSIQSIPTQVKCKGVKTEMPSKGQASAAAKALASQGAAVSIPSAAARKTSAKPIASESGEGASGKKKGVDCSTVTTQDTPVPSTDGKPGKASKRQVTEVELSADSATHVKPAVTASNEFVKKIKEGGSDSATLVASAASKEEKRGVQEQAREDRKRLRKSAKSAAEKSSTDLAVPCAAAGEVAPVSKRRRVTRQSGVCWGCDQQLPEGCGIPYQSSDREKGSAFCESCSEQLRSQRNLVRIGDFAWCKDPHARGRDASVHWPAVCLQLVFSSKDEKKPYVLQLVRPNGPNPSEPEAAVQRVRQRDVVPWEDAVLNASFEKIAKGPKRKRAIDLAAALRLAGAAGAQLTAAMTALSTTRKARPRLAKGLDSAEGAKPIWWMSPPRSCRSPFRARRHAPRKAKPRSDGPGVVFKRRLRAGSAGLEALRRELDAASEYEKQLQARLLELKAA